MLVVRPIHESDLDNLFALANNATYGLTTLPKDRDLLAQRIKNSILGFSRIDATKPTGETYLFVMEDTQSHDLVGIAGIVSKVGGFEPFYAYKLETILHESKQLTTRKEIQTLNLVAEHNGPCEIGSLFLHPDYRSGGNGRALSLIRFLFIAQFPHLFEPRVIAEMRGVLDENGNSPFWEAIGKHFFDIPLPTADYLSVVNKEFIGDLMPTIPIYVPLLPKPAQNVIGEVHPNTKPALKILQHEGFEHSGMVDIFEAGPVVLCPRDNIRTVRQSLIASLAATKGDPIDSPQYIVSNTHPNFRAAQTNLTINPDNSITLPSETAAALNLSPNDPLRYVTLRPASP